MQVDLYRIRPCSGKELAKVLPKKRKFYKQFRAQSNIQKFNLWIKVVRKIISEHNEIDDNAPVLAQLTKRINLKMNEEQQKQS